MGISDAIFRFLNDPFRLLQIGTTQTGETDHNMDTTHRHYLDGIPVLDLMPAIVEAVEANATVGEISDAMRQVYGEYHETVVI